MQDWIQRVMALVVLTAFVVGCNTVEGFGKDLGKLGNKIEQKADQNRNY